jgi:putative tryptophan/tyrosine transport system substrate-binding protein
MGPFTNAVSSTTIFTSRFATGKARPGDTMERRRFISLFGAAAVWPMPAVGQQVRRIGVLMALYAPTDREGIASAKAFTDTLQARGWTVGNNLEIDFRWPGGNPELIKSEAAALARSKPDLFVASANPAVMELHRLAANVPIVFTRVVDPVGSGFVASLARPGNKITGFQASDSAVGGKWVEILRELDPAINRIAVVYGSDSGGNIAFLEAAAAGAKSTAVTLFPIDIHVADSALDKALDSFSAQAGGGLIIVPHPWTSNRKAIIAMAERYRLPAIYGYRFFAADGGLVSYGPDQIDQWRGAAGYADRILRGEAANDLPVQAPTKYELVINLKAAKTIEFRIPPEVSTRADEIIE